MRNVSLTRASADCLASAMLETPRHDIVASSASSAKATSTSASVKPVCRCFMDTV